MKIDFSTFVAHDIDWKEITETEWEQKVPLYQLILRQVFYDFTNEDPIELPDLLKRAYSWEEIELTSKQSESLKKVTNESKMLTSFLKREFVSFIDKH